MSIENAPDVSYREFKRPGFGQELEKRWPDLALFPRDWLNSLLEHYFSPANLPKHQLLQVGEYSAAVINGSPILGLESSKATWPLLAPSVTPHVVPAVSEAGDRVAIHAPARNRTSHWAFPNLGEARKLIGEVADRLKAWLPTIDPTHMRTGHHWAGNQERVYGASYERGEDWQKQTIWAEFGNKLFDTQQNAWKFNHAREVVVNAAGFYREDHFEMLQDQPFSLNDHDYVVLGDSPEDVFNLDIHFTIGDREFDLMIDEELYANGEVEIDLAHEFGIYPDEDGNYAIQAEIKRRDGVVHLEWEGNWGGKIFIFLPGGTPKQLSNTRNLSEVESRELDIVKSHGRVDRNRFEIAKRNLTALGKKVKKAKFEDLEPKGLAFSPNDMLYAVAVELSDGHQTINEFDGDERHVWAAGAVRTIRKSIWFEEYA